MTTENYNKTIKFTEKGAITQTREDNTLLIENWVSSIAMTTLITKEFFIYDGMTYYLTSKVVKEIN